MRCVVSFGDLKQAALYFDRALPIAFKRAQGTGGDIVFDFPEHIPSRALISLVFGEHDLPEPNRYKRIGQILDKWSDFRKQTGPFRSNHLIPSTEDDYEDLRTAYLHNLVAPDSTPVREHFRSFAASLGLECSDVLLPSSERDPLTNGDEPILVLSRLNLIDTARASWEQIVELRKDNIAKRKLQRLRAFLTENYAGKSASFIEDDLGRRLDDYDQSRRKFGFETVTSGISVLLDSKSLQGALSAGIGLALFGGPIAGLSAAAMVELGRVCLEVARQGRKMTEWQASHELAYIIEGREGAL